MNKIYFDNAATTFPKPDSVIKAMFDYMSFEGGSANRGSHLQLYKVVELSMNVDMK